MATAATAPDTPVAPATLSEEEARAAWLSVLTPEELQEYEQIQARQDAAISEAEALADWLSVLTAEEQREYEEIRVKQEAAKQVVAAWASEMGLPSLPPKPNPPKPTATVAPQ
eukprot:3306298-Prymnesium_polylepis.1